MRETPAHYISDNKTSRIPDRHVFLDTESQSGFQPGDEVQTWRCGVATFQHWTSKGNIQRFTAQYLDPEVLWKEITSFTRPRRRTVVWTHNLPYDLRISQALHFLPLCGWSCSTIRLSQRGTWSKWTQGEATLLLCDTASVFPCELRTLGKLTGISKFKMPSGNDTGKWLAYCQRDVDILTEAMTRYLEWLREGDCGSFQVTGASQSWAHWRHSHNTHRILVHDDEDALEMERKAMWTGRAENWQWGRKKKEYIYEWDWANSYARICRDNDIPTRLVSRTSEMTVDQFKQLRGKYAILADVTVDSDRPVAPCGRDGGILWPVGSFQTTLWDPEISLSIEEEAKVTIHKAYLYRKAPALKQWATFMIDQLYEQNKALPGWKRIVLKHWSRTLIGRFAMRHQEWKPFGEHLESDISLGKFYNADEKTLTDMMQIGHQVWTLDGMRDVADACPQVTGYIMSVARVRLWNAATAVGRENVLYMDTDSLLLNGQGNAKMRQLTQDGHSDGLRLKSRNYGWEIYGPRCYIAGDSIKAAGLPKGAQRTSDNTFIASSWRGLQRSMQTREFDSVRITARRFAIGWNDKRRARCKDGTTTPYSLPSGKPSSPTGVLPPVTEKERQRYLVRELGAKVVKPPGSPRKRRGTAKITRLNG